MSLFKKKCAYCNKKIEKGQKITALVKVPHLKDKVIRSFCTEEHAEFYKRYVKGTPSKNSCPYCRS